MKNMIYLWGDSIGRGVVYDQERGRYCLAKGRCEKLLQQQGVALENRARMGATVADGLADFLEEEVPAGGVAVIEYGGNDCDLDWRAVAEQPKTFHDGKTPIDRFSALLCRFAACAREKGLKPVLVLPPPLYPERYFDWVCRGLDREAVRDYLGDVGHIGRWHFCYVEAIRRAARETGSGLLDLYTPFMRAMNFPELICLDGIHPSEAGQELMAKEALRVLGKAS
jgi:lysophospholipase L1-like esterase